MTTDHTPVTKTLHKLYPRLSLDDLDRLAREITTILDRGVTQGWDMSTIQLSPRKSTPLGLVLKKYREAARLLQADVAREADWSVSKVIRIESGQSGITPTDLRFLLDLYGVTDWVERSRLEQLARDDNRKTGRRGPRT